MITHNKKQNLLEEPLRKFYLFQCWYEDPWIEYLRFFQVRRKDNFRFHKVRRMNVSSWLTPKESIVIPTDFSRHISISLIPRILIVFPIVRLLTSSGDSISSTGHSFSLPSPYVSFFSSSISIIFINKKGL